MSKTCIHCGAEIHEQSAFCHICAQSQIEVKNPKPSRIKRKKIVLPVLIGIIVISLLLMGIDIVGEGVLAGNSEPVVHSEPTELGAIPAFEGPAEPDVEEAPVTTSPEPASEPEPSPAPVVLTGSNGELTYSDSDRVYRLSLSFYRSVGMNPPAEHDMTLEQMVGTGNFTYSQLFVTDRKGSVMSEEFFSKVRSIEASASLSDGTVIETDGPLINEEDPLALRSAKVFFGDHFGEITVCWTIVMENGEILVLMHTLTILELLTQPTEPILPTYLSAEDYFLRELSDAQLAALKDADAGTLQAKISTVADAVAYLDQFPHGRDSFYSAISGDLLFDIDFYTNFHRTEATGPDVYTFFAGWCLADDYPDAKFVVASGDSHGFTWIYHGLLLPTADGWHIVSPAGHSVYWNCVYGFDEMTIPDLEDLEARLIPLQAGMIDDSDLFIYHLYSIEVGRSEMNFWMKNNYLVTDSGAEELYRMPEEISQ